MNISKKIVEIKDVLLDLTDNLLLVELDLNDLTKEALDILIEFERKQAKSKISESYIIMPLKDRVERLILKNKCNNNILVERFKDDINWSLVNKSYFENGYTLPEEYKRYIQQLDNKVFSKEELKEHLRGKVSEIFILEHIQDINNYNLWSYIDISTLSSETIDKYFGKLDIDKISQIKNLSSYIIDKHSDKINWGYLCKHWKGWNDNHDIIEKYYHRLNSYFNRSNLTENKSISIKTILKYKELFNFDKSFCEYHDDETLIAFIDELDFYDIIVTKKELSKELSEVMLYKYMSYLDFIESNKFNEEDIMKEYILNEIKGIYDSTDEECCPYDEISSIEDIYFKGYYFRDVYKDKTQYSNEDIRKFKDFVKYNIKSINGYEIRFDDDLLMKFGDILNWNYICKINCSNDYFKKNFIKFNFDILDQASFKNLNFENVYEILKLNNKSFSKIASILHQFSFSDEEIDKIMKLSIELKKDRYTYSDFLERNNKYANKYSDFFEIDDLPF